MALLLITVQDMPDGTVSVRLHNEPAVAPGQSTFTPAQRMGAVALNAIHGALEQEGPKLVLVDAAGIPH